MRIVGIQCHRDPQSEFVLLQNQGALKTDVVGSILLDEDAILGNGQLDCSRIYAFTESLIVPASAYVMLISGIGEPGWARSRDKSLVFHQYWQRRDSVWSPEPRRLRLLGVAHTLQLRNPDALFVGQTA